MVTTIVRVTAWLLLLATVILSFAPPSYRPVPDIPLADIPHSVEHFAIFLAAGLAFGLSYSAPYLLQLIPLALFTAAVEIVQLWIPGRHARFSDFVIDLLGASIGLALGLAIVRFGGQRTAQSKREQ